MIHQDLKKYLRSLGQHINFLLARQRSHCCCCTKWARVRCYTWLLAGVTTAVGAALQVIFAVVVVCTQFRAYSNTQWTETWTKTRLRLRHCRIQAVDVREITVTGSARNWERELFAVLVTCRFRRWNCSIEKNGNNTQCWLKYMYSRKQKLFNERWTISLRENNKLVL